MINKIRQELKPRDLDLTFKDLPDINNINNINIVAERLLQVIQNNESIFFIGDLDADSLGGYSLFYHFMKQVGFTNYVRHNYSRNTDGYGSNLNKIKEQYSGESIVLYNDIGTSANKQVEWFKEQGAKVIITDHHLPSFTIPDTPYIVNTQLDNYPLKSLCAADIMFLVLAKLNILLGKPVNMNKDFLTVSVLSHISDIMRLDSVYQVFVKAGLKNLKNATIPYLKVLYDEVFGKWNKKVKAVDVSFNITPSLNSTHRLDFSSLAISFIESKTYSEALKYYKELVILNKKRKAITDSIKPEVNEDDKVIITFIEEDISKGFTGLIAGRIASQYNKPTLVYRKTSENIYYGSGRSPEGIPFKDKVNSSGLATGQGHQVAMGSSVLKNDIDNLKQKLNQTIDLSDIKTNSTYFSELSVFDITDEIVDELDKYHFGTGNPEIVFKDTQNITDIKPIGKSGYIKLYFNNIEMLVFEKDLNLNIGQEISFTYTIESTSKIMLVKILL